MLLFQCSRTRTANPNKAKTPLFWRMAIYTRRRFLAFGIIDAFRASWRTLIPQPDKTHLLGHFLFTSSRLLHITSTNQRNIMEARRVIVTRRMICPFSITAHRKVLPLPRCNWRWNGSNTCSRHISNHIHVCWICLQRLSALPCSHSATDIHTLPTIGCKHFPLPWMKVRPPYKHRMSLFPFS